MRKFLFVFLLAFIGISCDSHPTTAENRSDEAELFEISFSYLNEVLVGQIQGNQIILDHELAYYTKGSMQVESIEISAFASSSIQVGDALEIQEGDSSFTITSEDENTKNQYEILSPLDQDGLSLFTAYTEVSCDNFGLINLGELSIENNMWNSTNLTPGSFDQCVYLNNEVFGWEWDFPDDARGVNAYPQIIYGWKPFHQASTNSVLPRRIDEINTLKANYDVEVYRNDGDYNLAFDIWINSSNQITAQNIQFEFMIWEEKNGLQPFGDYVDTVNTSNGSYDFYQGEPDWEPAGSNWTYLAFVRKEDRQQGEVDIDELLEYLVSQEIVPSTSYIASIEFGNEIGNSSGYCVVKEFNVTF
ncbi:hypothetical protein N9L20_01895 [Flavobacteriaceae bacterium]|nr:hypothetical protein [Flavobacteriaceae bacterium]